MLAARTGLSPVMVGRATELARLRELAATTGDPAVALISGEAGIGKTRLVAELVATLDPAVAVLAGQGSQGAPGRPFQLLLEAVEPRVAAWDAVPERLADRSEPLRLLLAPVAPKLAGHAEREYGQEELLRAAVALVRELAGPDGAVLVFEDLHWADAESMALFGRLAVTPGLPLLLAGTFRPEGVAGRHPLVELLVELERQRVVTTIALERLSLPGVAELLAAVYRNPVPFQVAEALHRRTGGNPFFLEELVVTAGRADPARLAALPLPWNLGEAVLRRLDDLDPTQRRVVDAAAILGRRISFDLLAAVTGSGEDELIAILRHLVAGNLMVEEEPDVFAFRHALTREAIAGRLLGRERRRLHEKALAAIQESGGGDWAAVAWHAQGAGRYDELVETARTGAWSYLQQGSTAEALRLAETGLSEAERDLDLLSAASKAAWMIGLLPLAIEHGERWHEEAAATGKPELEAKALVHLARLYWEGQGLPAPVAERLGGPAVRATALVNKGTALADTPATSAMCCTGPCTTCLPTRSAPGRRSAAAGCCSACRRPVSGPAAGRRRPAGQCTAARSPSSRATWRRPWPPSAAPAAPSWSRSKAGWTRSGSTCTRRIYSWRPASSTWRQRSSNGTTPRSSRRSTRATPPGCGPSGWGCRPGAATLARPGPPSPATCRPRPGEAGAGSTASSASTA